MTAQLPTIKVQGGDYSTVPVRLKEFRQNNPRAKIETTSKINGDYIEFKAYILSDKADENSADATGHSYGENKGAKAYEKLETVAVGRALSLLGYLNNGQIASTEEMAEFEEYQLSQVIDDIKSATKREEFEKILSALKPAQKLEATPLIKARIAELKEA